MINHILSKTKINWNSLTNENKTNLKFSGFIGVYIVLTNYICTINLLLFKNQFVVKFDKFGKEKCCGLHNSVIMYNTCHVFAVGTQEYFTIIPKIWSAYQIQWSIQCVKHSPHMFQWVRNRQMNRKGLTSKQCTFSPINFIDMRASFTTF